MKREKINKVRKLVKMYNNIINYLLIIFHLKFYLINHLSILITLQQLIKNYKQQLIIK
jgi:hypothetical protein